MVDQRRIDLSSEPVARVRESGDQARQEMPARWPWRVWWVWPVEAE